MTTPERVVIRPIPTGVAGLDEVLGGGIPEYSFNMIAGAPGTGKTTLAEQIVFTNATAERPAIYFTVLGEPPLKMLRYQQQFSFFDLSRVGSEVRFINLSDEVLARDLGAVLARITREVELANPGVVVVDSFRTAIQSAEAPGRGEVELQEFVQRLALRLASWEATTFLVGEYAEADSRNPVFTIADGILWLMNEVERNSTQRKIRVTKTRGQAALPGLHTFRITDSGLEVYPRFSRTVESRKLPTTTKRKSTGVAGLDAMMKGGLPAGDSLLVTGPTGAGKTILATQFIAAGVRNGERGVIAVFEEHPATYVARVASLGIDLDGMVQRGDLEIMYLRPLDLSVDETLQGIRERVERLDASRVVVDSLSGFEIALAPGFRQDFRESFYRMVQALTALNVTVLSTMETTENLDYLRFSSFNISFLSDDIIAMRYVELEGALRTVLSVIKMRGSEHSRDLRAYQVTSHGLEIGETLHEYRGIITGVPELRAAVREPQQPELTTTEWRVLDVILGLGEAPADLVARQSGLKLEELALVLDRLVAVNYVRAIEREGQMLYRATTRAVR